MALSTTAMEETRKRQQSLIYEGEETAETKKVRGVAVSASAANGGDLGEDILAWLTMDDEAMTEVIQCLQVTNNNNKEEEGASSSSSSSSPTARGSAVKFIDNPYSSPVIFQSSCGYITINGNEESCGSSFSEWDSSVMASVDTGGIGSLGSNGGVGGGAWETDGVMARGGGGSMMMDGYDGSDWVVDDDCLAWVLGEEDCFDQ